MESALAGLLLLAPGAYAAADPPAVPLTDANQVRALTPDQASQGYPVRIRGVVTDAVPSPDFFVQDESAGIYVEGNRSRAYSPHVGDLVELNGITGPGRFAPVVREISSHIVGKSALPKTHLYAFPELAHGQYDSQWVQVRGIIRSVSLDNTSWREATLVMTVRSGPGQFKARIPIARVQDFSSWLGKEALITGVCGSLFNTERQFIGVLLYVPALRFLEAVAPVRELPVAELLRFSPQRDISGRVRVRGVVAYQEIGSALFLEAQGSGLQVRSQQNTGFAAGDVVEATGQPMVGESAPILDDATVTRVSHQRPPVAVDFNPAGRWEHYDGALVRIDAKLLHYERQADGPALLLQHSGFIFSAALPPGPVGNSLLSIPLTSDLRLTGICLVRNGGLWREPQSFHLLLRSDRDVSILQRPSWWNLRHTAWLLGITLGTLLIVLAWTMLLRRRIREQLEVLREKLRSSAVLEERNRIARELHDTLEQDLAGITLHLDLAADCFENARELSQQALDSARRMTRRSMIEARRSVWDLRSHLLENGTLGSALAQAVEPLAARSNIKIEVAVTGQAMRLNPAVEMNALRIGQEAITNAIKHARATCIEVELGFRAETLHLSVRDDGCGFDEHTAAMAGGAHFGLLDMKERANGLGSRLEISSTRGRGTCVEVQIPLESSKAAHGEIKADSYSRR